MEVWPARAEKGERESGASNRVLRTGTGACEEKDRSIRTRSARMSDPQEKAASGEEATGSEDTAHLSSHPQQVQGEAPVASLQTPAATATEDEESDDESEILEESPCGRWQKRKEEVTSFMFYTCFSDWSEGDP